MSVHRSSLHELHFKYDTLLRVVAKPVLTFKVHLQVYCITVTVNLTMPLSPMTVFFSVTPALGRLSVQVNNSSGE